MDWLQFAGVSAAGGIGGSLYWLFAEREQVFERIKAVLRRQS